MTAFNEVQRFRIKWVWLIVIAINALFIYAIVQQLVFGKPFGTNPAPDFVLVLLEVFVLGIWLFIISIRLKTNYSGEGISYRFYPLQRTETFIHWHELSDAYIREYNSFYEYGGWGIRYGSPESGRAVNTSESGKKGLQLVFRDGKKLLLGTKDPETLQQLIGTVMAAGKINRRI